MRAYLKLLFIILYCFSFTNEVFAKEAFSRLHRVFEVETNVKNRATQYIKKFIPENKFSIAVSVTPLLRNNQNAEAQSNSNLPFYDLSEQDSLDEWEDPLYPIDSLFQRIKEANLVLKIDDLYTPKNISLFKENILREAGLKVGRDDIKVEFVLFSLVEKKFNFVEMFSNPDFIQTFSLIAFALVALTLLSRFTKQTKTVTKETAGPTPNASMASAPPAMGQTSFAGPTNGAQEIKGDLSLSDPFQVSRVIKQKITDLLADDNFPMLQDLILLEELLEGNPNAFAFLIYEFPLNIQEKIFRFGRDENWNKGFLEAGIADRKVMLTLDQMLRERNQTKDIKFEKLRISLWRMKGAKLESFLSNVDADSSIGVLFHLPKELALPVARKLYPGSWAKILSEDAPYKFDDKKEVESLFEKATTYFPLFEIEALRVSKNKKDLLRYLYYVEPREEEEIYSVTGSMYDLKAVRPPFYEFFNLEKEMQEAIFSQYTIEQWALISFNASRKYRGYLNDLMDDKQKYLFSLSLKFLDGTKTVDLITRGKLREEIGLLTHDKQKTVTTTTTSEEKQEIVNDENDLAA